jgi:integrase
MNDEIKVHIFKYPDRKNLVMRYDDPTTGKPVTRTAGTDDESTAIGNAAVWQDELNSGRYQAASKVTWQQFIDQYTDQKLATLAPGTKETALVSLGHLKRIVDPDRLCKLTAAKLSEFAAEIRKPRTINRGGQTIIKPAPSDSTIARHLRHIKAALRWAERQGMIAKAPRVEMPKRVRGQAVMRGRPITAEELDRMTGAVPKVRAKDSAAWARFLEGLWLSGLRVSEALVLSWDQDDPFSVTLTGKRPCIRIFGEAQKSGRDEILPLVPDFAQFLTKTPEAERVGQVFPLLDGRSGKPLEPHRVSMLVSRIGKVAKVVTNKAEGKYAGCHDLRRSFGTRWAKRVMPAVLKRLMRHASIQTTMAYYVDLDAGEVADELWTKFGITESNKPQPQPQGNSLGNNPEESPAKEQGAASNTQHSPLLSIDLQQPS